MKKILFLSILALGGLTVSQSAHAQLWKRIKKEVKNRAENHVVNDAGNVTDKALDKTEDAAINSVKKGKQQSAGQGTTPEKTSIPTTQPTSVNTKPVAAASAPAAKPAIASYKSYDFVPGDQIIFQTDFKQQQNAELPARLGTLEGNMEIETYKGEKVLHINKGNDVCFIPMMDSANYLPEQFTVEFDFLYNAPNPEAYNSIEVDFGKADKDNNYFVANGGDYQFLIYEAYRINFGKTIHGRELPKPLVNSLKVPKKWHHVAIYVHNNIGKVYIDQYRVGASNMMTKGITKLAVKTNGHMDYLIKNLRIAGGGSDAYHKIMTEGKLITHGIHFASGSAKLLPESMGTINEVYNILKNHNDLMFEIDGHTDSDGSNDLNMKLSKQRADAVKAQLVKMGIDASRLSTKGFGETKPMDTNTTPEGKANNRRVEFVKV